jgi:hypothetical protein
MKRLKGPELKMPELKVPTFLSDLYYDLLDRRLLPLVALAVVAIAAVPFLLGGGSEESPQGSLPEESLSESPTLEGAAASSLTVVEAKPGLRDYRKRLSGRTPTDPFKQRYTGPVQGGGGQLNGQSTTSTSSSSPTSSTVTSTSPTTPSEKTPGVGSPPSGGEGGGGSGGGDGDGGKPSLRLFTFAIDVQISRSETKPNGRTVMGEPSTRRKVMPTTPLPGEKAPVVTYMGVDAKHATKVLLMVSNNVKSIFGDAKCLSGTDTCQLLEVEQGFPETFVYGPNDVRYKVKVLKIEPVLTGHA